MSEEPVIEIEETPFSVVEEVVTEEPVVVTEEEQAVVVTEEDQAVVVTEEEQAVVVTEEDQAVVVTEEDQAVVVTEEPVVTVEEQAVVVTEEDPEVKLDEIYAEKTDVMVEEFPHANSENISVEISEVQEPPPTPESKTPTLVFIVPYRDRENHYKLFSSAMKDALVNALPYKIFYINQKDTRGFNRGAMKNIGFLAVKNMYPTDYQNITLIFNDIDTMPSKDTILNYQTKRGVIKHFYGFDHTLGGIVSILASDFEILNGFPNFWAWGYEDNLLQNRAKNAGIVIDRSVFYKIHDSHIIHLTDTLMRTVNRAEFDRFLQNTKEGIDSIKELNYNVNDETGFIDVLQFNTTVQETLEKRSEYDLRNGPAPFKDTIMKNRRAPSMKMHF